MASIIYIRENSERMVFPLGRAMLMVGSDPESSLRLDDQSVSKNHASIIYEKGEYVLHDNGSTSGSFVNGERVNVRALKHNDLVRFGQYTFLVDLMKDSAGSKTNLPVQESTDLKRRGHSYKRSYQLEPDKKGSVDGPLKIVMADHHPRKQSPVPTSEEGASRNFALPIYCVIATILVFYFGWNYLNLESRWNQRNLEDRSTQELLTKKSAEVQEIQAQLSNKESQSRSLEDQLNKLRFEFEDYQKRNDTAKIAKLNVSLKQLDAEFKAYRESHPDRKLPDPIRVSTPDFTSKAGTPQLPNEVKLTADGQVIVRQDSGFPRYVTVSSGSTLRLIDVKGDDLLVETQNQEIGQTAKAKTNFQELMDELKKNQEDALEAVRQEKQDLFEKKVVVSGIINQVLPDGFISDQDAATGGKALIYVTGMDASILVNGNIWVGEAFPMGTTTAGKDKRQRRQFTVNFDEFYQYQQSLKKIAVQKEVNREVEFEELIDIVELLNLRELIKKTDLMDDSPDGFAALEVKKAFLKAAPDWQKAVNESAQLLKRKMKQEYRGFLRRIIEVNERVQEPYNFHDLHRLLQDLNGRWSVIKATSSGG